MEALRSGELARLAKVNVETLRFYERQGFAAVADGAQKISMRREP